MMFHFIHITVPMRSCAFATGVLVLTLAACSPKQKGTQIKNDEKLPDSYAKTIELDQGWTDDTQEAFYDTPQGSLILPYKWSLVLEQKDSKDPKDPKNRFLAPANIERFRYLPRKPSKSNPDGLPVGWVKDTDAEGQEWLGLTCPACHTAQIAYTDPDTGKSVEIRIDGGPTLADFNTMNQELVAALRATQKQPEKFKRFAKKILGTNHDENAAKALRGDLAKVTDTLATRNKINEAPHPYGFARIDAIGFIFNQTMATLPDMPKNAKPSDAPASYPFIWGTDQSNVVQWTGFAANIDGAGTLIRNAGEVIGVYGRVELTAKGDKYASSFAIDNLGKQEDRVRQLLSPQWPNIFPAIDKDKAARGKVHFDNLCIGCHQVIPRENEIKTAYEAIITPLQNLGTDPKELCNMSTRFYEAGVYEGKKYVAGIAGAEIKSSTTGLYPLINASAGALRDHLGESLRAFYDEHATLNHFKSGDAQGYKARPLNGIWATAPYLHNGSVPNLYELLLPADKRSKTFVLGSREYDPKAVGYSMTQPAKATEDMNYTPFVFDTRKEGNWNTGHEFGATCSPWTGKACLAATVNEEGQVSFTEPPQVTNQPGEDCYVLTEEQRWELVEYMKTL